MKKDGKLYLFVSIIDKLMLYFQSVSRLKSDSVKAIEEQVKCMKECVQSHRIQIDQISVHAAETQCFVSNS